MTTTAPSVNELSQLLYQTLGPELKQAEKQLSEFENSPGYPLLILQIVANTDPSNAPVRQAAAVYFKNLVKKSWIVNVDEEKPMITILPNDKNIIKNNLVELMCCETPRSIQMQISEAISIIASVDFPSAWTNLLPQLVAKLNTPDVNAVLLTANSLFKNFRGAERNDDLYSVIIHCVGHMQEPILTLFQRISREIDSLAQDKSQLEPRLETLRILSRIYFSLTWQDLPAFFEDHMNEWMSEFAKFFQYSNPILVDNDEEEETDCISKLQAAIVENLYLFADKDEECFIPFLSNFTSVVWNRLISLSSLPKDDMLATKSIKFLSILVGKLMHMSLFKDEATLTQIVEKIIVPNIQIREVDEEKFEEDPNDFLLADMEGYETESRRRCSLDLLKAMCRQFEDQTTAICLKNIEILLKQANDQSKWKLKDTAIHLMFGISIKAETSSHGVSIINEKVKIYDFFMSNILTELQDTDPNNRPMVKASAIKFASTFRNQFAMDHLKALMPLLITHLSSPFVVVHSYAAAGIEKILSSKEMVVNPNCNQMITFKKPKFTKADLQSFLQPLFTNLFGIIENASLNENEYAMKCIMRSLHVAEDDVLPATQGVIMKLTSALGRIAKNPRNPQYNHYLFESIAILIKSACSVEPNFTSEFEKLLFPPFETILQMDVAEFTPYVFQIFAQLLEYRPSTSGLGQSYTALFPPLLSPIVWERKGNTPALTGLMQAYIKRGASELIAAGHLPAILGVFQKLLSSPANEVNAFALLDTILIFVPSDALQSHLKLIIQYVLMRLQQQSKKPRLNRLVSNFFALMSGKYSGSFFLEQLSSIQPNLGLVLLQQSWLPRLKTNPPGPGEVKTQLIGLTKLLSAPQLLADSNSQLVWAQILQCIISIVSKIDKSEKIANEDDATDAFSVEITGFDSTFSRLHFASRPPVDAFAEITDATLFFLQNLSELCASQPGKFAPIVAQALNTGNLGTYLEGMMAKAGLRIV